MYRIIILSLLITGFFACAIHINPDNWQYLSEKERNRFISFNEANQDKHEYQYKQITSENIRQNLPNQPYSWVILVNNCCSAYPQSLKTEWLPLGDSLTNRANVKTYVVFNTYRLTFLDFFMKDCQPKELPYILDNQRYGNNFRKKISRFLREIVSTYQPKKTGTVHLLFNAQGKCLFADEESLYQSDSLIKRSYIKQSLTSAIRSE
jgi:hypothetical protein